MGYMAPELLKRCYTEAADVWSAGVMLYEMIAGQLPFALGNTVEEVRRGGAVTGWHLSGMASPYGNPVSSSRVLECPCQAQLLAALDAVLGAWRVASGVAA